MKRLLFVAFSAAALSACGGGGGGGGSSAAIPSAPAPAPTSAPIQTTSVQRAVASGSLISYSGTQQATSLGGYGGASTLGMRRRLDAAAARVTSAYRAGARATAGSARRAQSVAYSACSNGAESATVAVSASEEQLYERSFYDSACTKLHQDIYLDLVATGATSATATGNDTLYSLTGAVYAYETLTMSLTGVGTGAGTFSVVLTDAASASSPTIASIGVACTMSSATLGCGIGAVTRQSGLAQDVGATANFTLTVPASTAGAYTVPVTGSANTYTGALGALSLGTGTFPNFAVSGGTLTDNGTFTGSFTYVSGELTASSFSLTDAASDGTATITSSGTPPVTTGTIKRTSTGAVLATFTVDAAGNGTITYSNGTTGQIVNWQVVG